MAMVGCSFFYFMLSISLLRLVNKRQSNIRLTVKKSQGWPEPIQAEKSCLGSKYCAGPVRV